jgi:hypothetical protein
VLEFRWALAEAGEAPTWLEGRCISCGQSIPFRPRIDQLRENFRIEELDGEPEIIAKVEHGMRRMGELETHIPAIRYLLGVDPGDPEIAVMDAAARRKKLFDAGLEMILRGARLRPLVLVFEDLHWIDTSTEEYLSVLMDSVAGVVPQENRLGIGHEDEPIMLKYLMPLLILTYGAAYLGIASGAFELACQEGDKRFQSGARRLDSPMNQRRLAEMSAQMEAARCCDGLDLGDSSERGQRSHDVPDR